MKIVLDTNCLVAALPTNSPYHCVWEAFNNGDIILCFTTEILEEYNEILARFYSAHYAENVINMILNAPNAKRVTIYYHWHFIISDPDDDKFVDCAVSANARFIVSNDRHFNVLKYVDFPKIEVCNIQNFAKMI
ncbi:MAG: putative toxin-antitoxin system toxin component, PIN family [Candidatus Symbiothrix sp.]|jgi:putative PIN family toxin of toxin-antitoxin system|nr:putative toxin-antitoxin system toxin component, PIN family [Candidatus Symbiothrix sp.]